MGKKDPRIDAYIAKARPFAQPILEHLRKVVHTGCPDVEETIKWSAPAFDYKGPFAGMAAFKAHVLLGFWKGSLLNAAPGGDSMGPIGRITSLDDLPSERKLVALVRKAAALNEKGVKVARVAKAKPPLVVPASIKTGLKKKPRVWAAFESLSPSHKREYVEWITEAKTEPTRQKRLASAITWIAEGKSRHWKYERPKR